MTRSAASTGMQASGTTLVSIQGLAKSYGKSLLAVADLSLDIAKGEFVSLLGPSGCGKTTTLRCVAGLEDVTEGTISIGSSIVSRPGFTAPPHERGIGMVFQSYALWPHMTAAENVGYPLKMASVAHPERRQRVEQVLADVGMSNKAGAHPYELSGGQQQRVALARALVANPTVVLFDEPLSNLDAHLREQMRKAIRGLQSKLGFSALYVTHDRLEAMVMSDRVVVMQAGRAVQIGPPAELYWDPSGVYVARALGDVNELHGTLVAVEGETGALVAVGDLRLWGKRQSSARLDAGDDVTVLIRFGTPTLEGGTRGGSADNVYRGVVRDLSFMGEVWQSTVQLDGAEPDASLQVLSLRSPGTIGDKVTLSIAAGEVMVLPRSLSAAVPRATAR